ncbi:hypothetical protein MSAN_00084000 [Mycena sanguinolenta]|uniref:Uncharacterized protein n=1 Tax=Mycena sanguinolenta TaxID=230812 RepID=A0A8H6ZI09_9AGAR|nr:hypothetical protein MSAN_00084000 [Mycena sanguinolenta]
MARVDLKQVGKLFNDTIAAIRDDTPDMQPQAIEWLKAARYKLMRDVEKAYYELERTRDDPMSQPSWALDPTQSLILITNALPAVLDPYRFAMRNNLSTLLTDCGFQVTCYELTTLKGPICLYIHFPAQLTAAPAVPHTLHIDDEFSTQTATGAFGAGNFAHLLTNARNDGTAAGGKSDSESTAGKKRRRASRSVKTEEDEENDEEEDRTRRLRSVTRASSTATLRSTPGRERRSGRKRVKKEED